MYNGGFDGGASQFNGGGFMPTPGGAPAGGGSAQKKSYDQTSQAVRRVTTKQLHKALEQSTSDTILLDGKEVVNVALVGKVINVREDNVTFSMLLDDGTGRITVKIFINDAQDDFERQRRAELREGIYVKVFGHLSQYNNEGQITCFSARPLTDYNEVSYHLSQVIFQHLHLTKGGADAGLQAPKFEGAGAGLNGTYAAAPVGAPIAFGGNSGMNPIQSEVMNIFNAPDAVALDAGFTIPDVIARSGNRLNQQQVMMAVNYLVEEGFLYSTIDDAHWKSCA